jgi:hypothetical protein
MIPHLVGMGVNAISVGSNGANGSPQTPAKVFKWLDKQTNTQVYATWHPRGYGGLSIDDCVLVPNFKKAMCILVELDNRGPATPAEVSSNYQAAQSEFPNAKISASTFDAFFAALAAADKAGTVNLPVATSEISDVWMYGVASDPLKMAKYRIMARLRTECFASYQCADDERTRRFSVMLLKIPEHTWGISINSYLRDYTNYKNKDFHPLQYTDAKYKLCTSSWVEQRDFLDMALLALEDHPLATKIKKEIENLKAITPDLSQYTPISAKQEYQTPRFNIKFDEATGGISGLFDKKTSRQWAGPKNKIAELLYQTFDDHDFAVFLKNFMYNPDTRNADFDKPGLAGLSEHHEYAPKLRNLYKKKSATNSTTFLAEIGFDDRAHDMFGSYQTIWVTIDVSATHIDIRCDMFNKTSTRIPESLFLSFNPIIKDVNGYAVEKLGSLVSPLDIMRNGSVHQHGVTKGVIYLENKVPALSVAFHDTPIVAMGSPDPFPSPMNVLPDLTEGFHANFYNNIWGTK